MSKETKLFSSPQKIGDGKKRFIRIVDGKSVETTEEAPKQVGVASFGYESNSLGGAHTQAADLREHLRMSGVPTEVLPNGNPVIKSLQHQRKLARALGMRDNDSFL